MDFSSIRLITFDCYGTLIDWETGILASLRALLHNLPPIEDDKLLNLYGEIEAQLESGPYMAYRAILGRAAQEIARRLSISINAADAQRFAESLRLWKPFPDTVEALQLLAKKYKLAIISNVDDDLFADTQRMLKASFEFVVTAQQVRSYKPSQKNFQEALKRAEQAGIHKDQVLHAAESLYHDIGPANALGLKTVWVHRRFDKPGFGATKPGTALPSARVRSVAELSQKLTTKDPKVTW
ncbi:MAG TPA: haloacid dehalogenase type II [Candidatus Angelobacter sp.]